MAMAEDVPLLEKMTPGGKPHPIDKVLHHLDKVTLGDTTLVAHLVAGHTPGATVWTTTVRESGRNYNVVIMSGMGAQQGLVEKDANRQNSPKPWKQVLSIPVRCHATSFSDHTRSSIR